MPKTSFSFTLVIHAFFGLVNDVTKFVFRQFHHNHRLLDLGLSHVFNCWSIDFDDWGWELISLLPSIDFGIVLDTEGLCSELCCLK